MKITEIHENQQKNSKMATQLNNILIKIKLKDESLIVSWIKKNHPYKIPEIVGINSDILNNEYLEWFFKKNIQ